ncbi:MAG: glucose-6-phosphate isomerase, partial [Pseudomonadota bacterium]
MHVKHISTWQTLERHVKKLKSASICQLFEKDSRRFDRFSLEAAGILLDFSKNLLTEKTLKLLIALADEKDLAGWINKIFSGEKINSTENRSVLHTALRNRSGNPVYADGKDVMPDVYAVLEKMRKFSHSVRSGEWKGHTGRAITDIVNIGIGGSNLGPAMVTEALTPYAQKNLSFHFVSNIDATHIAETVKDLAAESTLFIIASKTFTTLETMANANTARQWFLQSGGKASDIARHFVAVSTNTEEVSRFGIDPANMFEFWDWVGGRYSVWSAIGLPVVLAIGMEHFEAFLEGAYDMDKHFRTAGFRENIPVILGLTGILYNNFFKYETHALLPYDQYP